MTYTPTPPYRPLHKVLAGLVLAVAAALALGAFLYAAIVFGDKGVFNPNAGTEMHINLLEGRTINGAEAQPLTIPGDPGGFAEPYTTYMVRGEQPLQLTTAYRAIAEAGQLALLGAIIVLLAVGSLRVLLNKPNAAFARVGLLVLGVLTMVVSVLVPFFQKQTGQATLQELGITAETADTVIVAEFFDLADINFLLLGLGLVLVCVGFLFPRRAVPADRAEADALG